MQITWIAGVESQAGGGVFRSVPSELSCREVPQQLVRDKHGVPTSFG